MSKSSIRLLLLLFCNCLPFIEEREVGDFRYSIRLPYKHFHCQDLPYPEGLVRVYSFPDGGDIIITIGNNVDIVIDGLITNKDSTRGRNQDGYWRKLRIKEKVCVYYTHVPWKHKYKYDRALNRITCKE